MQLGQLMSFFKGVLRYMEGKLTHISTKKFLLCQLRLDHRGDPLVLRGESGKIFTYQENMFSGRFRAWGSFWDILLED